MMHWCMLMTPMLLVCLVKAEGNSFTLYIRYIGISQENGIGQQHNSCFVYNVFNCHYVEYKSVRNFIGGQLKSIEVWGSAAAPNFSQITKLHKRAVQIVKFATSRVHTAPIFNQVAMFVYKFLKQILPNSFNEIIRQNRAIHRYLTGQSTNLHVNSNKTSGVQNTVKVPGMKIRNHISDRIEHNCKISSFKQNLKTSVLSHNYPLSECLEFVFI